MTNVLHTGALRCPDPGFKFAMDHNALQNPFSDARSIRLPSNFTSKGVASRPSSDFEARVEKMETGEDYASLFKHLFPQRALEDSVGVE